MSKSKVQSGSSRRSGRRSTQRRTKQVPTLTALQRQRLQADRKILSLLDPRLTMTELEGAFETFLAWAEGPADRCGLVLEHLTEGLWLVASALGPTAELWSEFDGDVPRDCHILLSCLTTALQTGDRNEFIKSLQGSFDYPGGPRRLLHAATAMTLMTSALLGGGWVRYDPGQ